MPNNILEEICLYKLEHIAERKKNIPLGEIKKRIKNVEAPRGFLSALKKKIAEGGFGLIAEIKKASPSKGLIRADFEPSSLARQYKEGGASCISVLTDEKYFRGKDEYLSEVKKAVDLPVLRKDFMLDPYQVYEARMLGADCILLIIAALKLEQAKELEQAAMDLGMDVLIENHNAEEVETALKLKSKLIGINNRNLKTLAVDIDTTLQLAAKVPATYTLVSESGIGSYRDVEKISRGGVRCFLVGESLMRRGDVTMATKELLNPL